MEDCRAFARACEKFSNVSALVSFLYKITMDLTFEKFYLEDLGSFRARI